MCLAIFSSKLLKGRKIISFKGHQHLWTATGTTLATRTTATTCYSYNSYYTHYSYHTCYSYYMYKLLGHFMGPWALRTFHGVIHKLLTARAVLMAQRERIYVLMIEVNKLFSFRFFFRLRIFSKKKNDKHVSSRNFLKETENMFPMFL